jgi:hypothetical protein
MDVLQALFSF